MFNPRLTKSILAACIILPVASAQSAEAPAKIQLLRSEMIVASDGTAVQTSTIEIAVSNDAAARQEAQQSLIYADDVETVRLIDGYTQKPDGRRVPIPVGAVRIQLAPGTPNLPQYTNRKQIIAILPDVAGGDVLSVTWRRVILNPTFPGHVAFTSFFLRTLPWDDVDVSISVPESLTLNTEAHGPAHTEVNADGRRTHRWRWSAPALVSDPAVLSPLDRAPRIFASTFPDWAAFSRTYAGLVAPKAEVTPAVQARADQVTAGARDRREEAKRLYEYVSRQVRWVAIYVGDGAFVPHPADEVLANGYGDCKDQVVLLMALLRARGIAAEPVLVNLEPTYTLSGPPTLTAFNHVMTYMPEWDLYADTTAGGASFGIVQAQEYGKPILHVTAAGAPPSRMVVMSPDLATERLHTKMRLELDGRITGDSTTEAAGPYATALRQYANQAMAQGSERAAAERLRVLNQPGQGAVSPAPLDPVQPTYTVSARFTLDARPGIVDGDGFVVPTGIRLLARPGDGLLGPVNNRNLPPGEPTPCYAGRQEEDLSLSLPPGYRIVRLPRPRKADNAAFNYDSRWSLEDGTLRVVRRFESRIDQPLCEGPLRIAAARALEDIRRDYEVQVELEKVD